VREAGDEGLSAKTERDEMIMLIKKAVLITIMFFIADLSH
jgi:hypothetical protein